jgi:hypothetical protein
VNTGRIDPDLAAQRWVARFIGRPPDGRATSGGCLLDPLPHGCPADRFLISTAIELACALVTYDARPLEFAHANGRRHGFRVAETV